MQSHSLPWNFRDVFENRTQAGELLAQKIQREVRFDDCLVLGITRGGVVVAAKVAERLRVPLDIIVVKKIGAPENPELAIGAVGPASDAAGAEPTVVWDKRFIGELGIDEHYKTMSVKAKMDELTAQESKFRSGRLPLSLRGKDVCLVDDGVATGATVLCARDYLVVKKARRIILAVPVIAEDTLKLLTKQFDTIVTLRVEKDFRAVGQFYRDFPQVSDEEVIKIINSK